MILINTGKRYKTKQNECILKCIKEDAKEYITIQQIAEKLNDKGDKVGLTTIYRNLEKLEKENKIAKVSIDGISGTCYRYLEENQVFFSFKCEKCGKLINIECSELEKLYSHVSDEHNIFINAGKTMFYGICKECK